MIDLEKQYPELFKIYNKNSHDVKKKIMQVINNDPADADCGGWIYGYFSPVDKHKQHINDFYIKLGRTERNPFTRVEDEWKGEIIFCIKTSYNHKLERLVHLFFDYAREKRKEDKNDKTIWQTMCSYIFWFRNNENEVFKKEVEWFHFTEDTNVQSVVSHIASIIEKHHRSVLYPENNIGKAKKNKRKININNASIGELMLLPHIGKPTAQKILDYRKEHKFRSEEDIKNVAPVLKRRYDKICDRICV